MPPQLAIMTLEKPVKVSYDKPDHKTMKPAFIGVHKVDGEPGPF